MAFYRMKLVWKFALLPAILFAGSATAQDCMNTEFQDEQPTCPSGMVEIFTNQDKYSGSFWSRCCVAGSQGEKYEKPFAQQCQYTECVSKADAEEQAGNLCDTYNPYRLFMGGQEIMLADTVQDQCKIKSWDGREEIGTQSLCCPDHGTDLLLTTLYGTESYEFPHFVRLGGCGGTVYNKRWVLTAGHCVTYDNYYGKAPGLFKKSDTATWDGRIGTVRINIDLDNAYTENTYNVVDIKIHPNCSRLKPADPYNTLFNDIALVKVDRDIQFNDKVKALRIAEQGFKPLDHGSNAIIVGFGKTNLMIYSKKLQKANVPIRPSAEYLKHSMANQWPYSDQLMMVGGIYKGDYQPGAGTGDSGGPAICRDEKGMAILCGITSFTTDMDSCKKNLNEYDCTPSGYVDVGYFSDWIKSVAGDQRGVQFLELPLFGSEVPANKYSNQVHITSNGGEGCGGTLIGDDIVVTAASCVADGKGKNRNGIRVTTGLRDLEGKGEKTFGVKAVVLLQGYGEASSKRSKRVVSIVLESWEQNKLNISAILKDPYYNNNIAVLKLDGKTGIKNLAKLASTTVSEGESGTEISFPLKPNNQNEKKRHLSQREFKLLSREDCQKRLDRLSVIGFHVHLENTVFCGVERYSGGSMCDRELGGGLFCKEGGNDVLCGVQAFRTCEFNLPNAFMDVGGLKDWFKQAMDALK